MGSRRRRRRRRRNSAQIEIAQNPDERALSSGRSSALEENVQAVKRWEKTILLARSKAEQVSDWIACTAGSGPVLVLLIDASWWTTRSVMDSRIQRHAQFSIASLASHRDRQGG